MQVGVSGSGKKRPWTPDDDLVMERLYPTTKAQVLVEILDRSDRSIRVRASFLKLPKCKIFRSNQQSENGKKWFYNTQAISTLTVSELEKLTAKVKKA